MRPATLVERLYARHAAGLPFLPVAGGGDDDAPAEARTEARPAEPAKASPAPTAVTVNATSPTAEPAKPPEGVLISPEQAERYKQMEAAFKTLQAADEARAEEARKAAEKQMLEEGKLKELLVEKNEEIGKRDARLRETEAVFKATVRDKDLAVELAKHAWVDGATPKLTKLLRDEFEVVKDGDVFKTQTRDGKTVERYVAELHRSPDYAMFVPPASRGGAGSQGADRRAPEPAPVDPNDRMAAQLRASYKARHENVPVSLAGRNRLAGGSGGNN